jgi:hypothetical protein
LNPNLQQNSGNHLAPAVLFDEEIVLGKSAFNPNAMAQHRLQQADWHDHGDCRRLL